MTLSEKGKKHFMRPKGPAEVGLLLFCNNLRPWYRMVEIGCFAGESTIIFAPRVRCLYAVDPWLSGYDDDDIGSRVMNEEIENDFDKATNKFPNIVKMKMTSLQAHTRFANNTLDVVYIDACHKYEAVKNDIVIWKPKVKKGGIIAGHDFCMDGVKKAVLESIGRVDEVYVDSSWFVRL